MPKSAETKQKSRTQSWPAARRPPDTRRTKLTARRVQTLRQPGALPALYCFRRSWPTRSRVFRGSACWLALLALRRCQRRCPRVSRVLTTARCRIRHPPRSRRWSRRSRERTRSGSTAIGHGVAENSCGSAAAGWWRQKARATRIGASATRRMGRCSSQKKLGTTRSCSPSRSRKRSCQHSRRRTCSHLRRNTAFDRPLRPGRIERAWRFGDPEAERRAAPDSSANGRRTKRERALGN